MVRARAGLILVLVVFHVGLVATAALHSADFAWAPSYFDDDDGDFLPLLLSEQIPAMAEPARGLTPALTVLAAAAAWQPRGRSRLVAARTRFRAPPRP